MLSFYSVVLEYFINVRGYYCYYRYSYYGGWTCDYYLSSDAKDLGIGMTSFLLFLAIFELACSIGSVVLSGKAYCKCCNTCDANDCCTCLGCCQCDTAPLNIQQVNYLFTKILYSANLFYFPISIHSSFVTNLITSYFVMDSIRPVTVVLHCNEDVVYRPFIYKNYHTLSYLP